MKITLIGCGYVGLATALKLKTNGHYLTVTTRSSYKASDLARQFDRVCILEGHDQDVLRGILKDQEIVILCMAADDAASYESTYLKTAKALSHVVEGCPKLNQVIYTSSTSVYGDHQGKVVDENIAPSPDHATSQILVETEKELTALERAQRKVCVLRLGEIVGPGREIVDRLRRLNGASMGGTGENFTNLTHLDDIVGAIEFAIEKQLNGIYNLCHDEHLPRRELYRQICTQEGLPEIKWDGLGTSRHSGNKIVSNAKIKAAGYSFRAN